MNCTYCNKHIVRGLNNNYYECENHIPKIRYVCYGNDILECVVFLDRDLFEYELISLNYILNKTKLFLYSTNGRVFEYKLDYLLPVNPDNYEYYLNKYRRLINFK